MGHASGWLTAVDKDWHWVRTAEGFWRLGWPNDALPPIMQLAMQPDRRGAHELAVKRTASWTLPGLVSQHAATFGELYIAAVAATLVRQRRHTVAAAWQLMQVEGDHVHGIEIASRSIQLAVKGMLDRDRSMGILDMVEGWRRLCRPRRLADQYSMDPILGAHLVAPASTINDNLRVRVRWDEDSPKGRLH
jgi:hypothetical protein